MQAAEVVIERAVGLEQNRRGDSIRRPPTRLGYCQPLQSPHSPMPLPCHGLVKAAGRHAAGTPGAYALVHQIQLGHRRAEIRCWLADCHPRNKAVQPKPGIENSYRDRFG